MNRIQSIKIKLNIPTLNPKERYKQGTTQHKLSNYYKRKGKSKTSKKNPYPKRLWVSFGKAKTTPSLREGGARWSAMQQERKLVARERNWDLGKHEGERNTEGEQHEIRGNTRWWGEEEGWSRRGEEERSSGDEGGRKVTARESEEGWGQERN